MGIVNGLTGNRQQDIVDKTVTNAAIIDGDLILYHNDGSIAQTFDSSNFRISNGDFENSAVPEGGIDLTSPTYSTWRMVVNNDGVIQTVDLSITTRLLTEDSRNILAENGSGLQLEGPSYSEPTKISDLISSSIDSLYRIPVVQEGATKYTTPQQLRDLYTNGVPAKYSFVGANSGNALAGTITPPSGIEEDDLCLFFMAVTNDTPSASPVGDWTPLLMEDQATSDYACVAYKFAGSEEPSTWKWEVSSPTSASLVVAVFRGVTELFHYVEEANSYTTPSVLCEPGKLRVSCVLATQTSRNLVAYGDSSLAAKINTGTSSASVYYSTATDFGGTGSVVMNPDSNPSGSAIALSLGFI